MALLYSTAATVPRVCPPGPWPGLLLTLALALPAFLLGKAVPVLGGAVIGIVLGIAFGHLRPPTARYTPGIAFTGKRVLQASVVLLGFGLDLGQVARVGLDSLPVVLVTVAAAFTAAWGLGRLLRVPGTLTLLIGTGTAICGGSAIAAVAPIIRPGEHEMAYAISTIFLFNLLAVLLFPPLGHLLQLSDAGFGLWAGTAINDTSSVVAAGYQYSPAAGDQATIVKLARATLIVPICLVFAAVQGWRGRREGGSPRMAGVFPWFILGFLAASGLRSAGAVPGVLLPALHLLAGALIVVALTAIGLSADLRRMAASGPRPILLGLGTWMAVAMSSLLVQATTGQL